MLRQRNDYLLIRIRKKRRRKGDGPSNCRSRILKWLPMRLGDGGQTIS